MRGDGAARGLAAALDSIVPTLAGRAALFSTWDAIDALAESELDDLAWELNITWYDSAADIETKRDIVRSSNLIRLYLGTPGAVERFMRSYYPESGVEEWFEYGGEPYFFRLHIDIEPEDVDAEKRARMLESVKYVKNVRSHIDKAFFTATTPLSGGVVAGAATSYTYMSTALPEGDRATEGYIQGADGEVRRGWIDGGGLFPMELKTDEN
jgi:phage tail P2-like protein